MKKCLNCKSDCRDTDAFCRNCGLPIKKNSYYVIINIFNFLMFLGILFMIALFVASYYV